MDYENKGMNMELLTVAAIIAGIIAAILGLIAIIKKISEFYKRRFQFSIWSGVLLLVLSLAFLAIAGSDNIQDSTVYILITLAALLVIATIFNDIRLAKIGWGLIALSIQIVLAVCFVFLVFFALIAYVIKKVFNIHSSLFGSLFDSGFGVKSELLLLRHFICP